MEGYYHEEGRINLLEGGRVEYTLKDHLGNGRVFCYHDSALGEIKTNQEAHYYPFGLPIQKLSPNFEASVGVEANNYQYNSKELNEDFGLHWMDYGARWYDLQINRWGQIDPLAEKFYHESPYVYVGNNPIYYIDPNGLFKYPANSGYEQTYTKLTNYLMNGIGNLLNQSEIREGLRVIGGFSDAQIDELAKFGKGIEIRIAAFNDPNGSEANGYTAGDYFVIHETLAKQLQKATTPEDEQAALFSVISTILHESTHVGFNTNTIEPNARNITDGRFSRKYKGKGNYDYFYDGNKIGDSSETGNAFEKGIWFNGDPNSHFQFYYKQGEEGIRDRKKLIDQIIERREEYRLPWLKK